MAAVRFIPGKGVKRKRGEEDGGQLAFCCESLLDLSLLKMHQSCMVSECNLRRSVLIANTLRRLQAEGGQPTGGPVIQPAPVTVDLNNNRAEPSAPGLAEIDLLSGNDASLSSAISTILQDLDYMEGLGSPSEQPALEEDHLLRPSASNPRPEPRTLDSIFATFEIADSDAFLVDGSLDAIFEDIDTSMYDAQPGLSAGVWDPVKPAAPAPCPLTKASWDCSSARTPNSRTEFADLENLMDLLVG